MQETLRNIFMHKHFVYCLIKIGVLFNLLCVLIAGSQLCLRFYFIFKLCWSSVAKLRGNAFALVLVYALSFLPAVLPPFLPSFLPSSLPSFLHSSLPFLRLFSNVFSTFHCQRLTCYCYVTTGFAAPPLIWCDVLADKQQP